MRAGLAAAILLLAACAPPAPPSPVEPPPPGPPAPSTDTVPPAYDPGLATATLLVRATAMGTLPRMRPIDFAEPEAAQENPDPVLDQTIVSTEGRLANVIAWVSRGAARWTFAPETTESLLELRKCIFVPHVLTLRTGQPLRVSNPGHTMLHFHAVSELNGETNEGIPKGKSATLRFSREEVGVRLKCDVHGWMHARVGAFPHPFHGVTDREGTLAIRVPPGEYEVSAWHEYAKFEKPGPRTVTVAEGGSKEIEFTFAVK